MRATRSLVASWVALAALLATPAGAADEDLKPSDPSRIDAVFASYDNTRSPGCSIAVVRAGRILFERGYGMADLERGVPLSPESVFRIASTSKQFTAASITLLSLEGKLGLSDDVRRYIPELQPQDPPFTVLHLIHHTSGVRDYLTLMRLAGQRDADYYSDGEVLAMLARQEELNFPAGEEHLYSNSGYWLLSQIISRLYGASMREYAQQRIFEPLGMDSTHFHDEPSEIVPQRALGYAPSGDGGFKISMTQLPMIGDGGVFTTVRDLARWDANFYDSVVGGAAFLDSMLKRAVLNSGEVLPYASGLEHGQYRGLEMVGHGGAFVGFRAQMFRFPEQRATIVCLCNRADATPSRLVRRVADIVLEDQLSAPSPTGATTGEDEPETAEPAITLTLDQSRALVGDYYSGELDAVYHLRSSEGALSLAVGNHPSQHVDALAPNRLRVRDRGLVLEMDLAGNDPATGFRLQAGRVKNLHFSRRKE